ncbi:hypothetical protein GCM10028807_39190 [Spirosoma daeguense]
MKLLYSVTLTFITTTLWAQPTNYTANVGNSATPGSNNVFVGHTAGISTTTGFANAFIGSQAGPANTTGNFNAFLGYAAGRDNTTGSSNTLVGYLAGTKNTLGESNSFLGYMVGTNTSTGSRNTFIGGTSGYTNTSGHFNTAIGYLAGKGIESGHYNVMIGYGAETTNGNIQNAVAVGANAKVAVDNAIVLGDPTNPNITVGIGTDSPQFPLDVRGIIRLQNNGTIKFSHLSNPLRNGTTDQFLTVNEQGETVLASHRLRIANVNQWSDKVFEKGYTLRPLTSVDAYIQQHGHLPGVPSAEDVVKEGIDLTRMNATLLEKVEELTLYSIQLEKKMLASDAQRQLEHQKINQLEAEMLELKTLLKQMQKN